MKKQNVNVMQARARKTDVLPKMVNELVLGQNRGCPCPDHWPLLVLISVLFLTPFQRCEMAFCDGGSGRQSTLLHTHVSKCLLLSLGEALPFEERRL